jgi:hypothetical protein
MTRRRGAQPGNRNAWKHGRYSAEAVALRGRLWRLKAALRRTIRLLPPVSPVHVTAVLRRTEGEGGPPLEICGTNKPARASIRVLAEDVAQIAAPLAAEFAQEFVG